MQQLLERIRQFGTAPASEPQKPGRHSEAGLVERLRAEVIELTAQRDEARDRSNFHLRGWKAADLEVKRLRQLHARTAATTVQAPADRPDFQPEPADPPTPERDQEQLPPIALTLPRPVECEAADVNAETQPVPQLRPDQTQPIDVTTLREALGMGRTAVIPIVPASPAQIPAGPGSTDPTEVSSTTARRAVISVAAAISQGATQ